MKNFIYNIAVLSGLSLMTACQSENVFEGEGYIQFAGVQLDKNVETRAAEAAEKLAVDIKTKDGVVFKHADDWNEIKGQNFLVPAGTVYNVTAYSFGKTAAQGFDAAPYYEGTEQVTVKANEAQNLTVTCKLAQSMVSVTYSDQFKARFSEYSATLTGNEAFSLAFPSTESRPAYVLADQPLNIRLNFKANGSAEASELTQKIVDQALPAYHYVVKFDVDNNGTGNITVTVNQNRTEYEATLGVPTKPDGLSTIPIAGDNAKVWGKYAVLDGSCSFVEPSSPVQFKYKKSSDADWKTVDAQKVGETNEYTAKVTALDFATEYQYKLVCGETEGAVCSFVTESFVEIPNLNFDTWTQSGKNWFANADAADSYWASGNTGVTSRLAGNNPPITVPETSDVVKGQAAKMHTITGVTLVGAAAGNLFIGNYKTNMSNPSASVSFGRPYNGARPTRLTGYYKYDPKPITHGSHPGNLKTDECNIYVSVWDEAGNQIGFGEFVGKEQITEYTKFSFDIAYSDPSKKAAKIAIVTTSSHYGGHFEGAKVTGQLGTSTLWVDEFELSYD